jgi:hypothetical protein
VVDERAFTSFVVEDHPEIHGLNTKNGRGSAQEVIQRVGVTTHVFGKEIDHDSLSSMKPVS